MLMILHNTFVMFTNVEEKLAKNVILNSPLKVNNSLEDQYLIPCPVTFKLPLTLSLNDKKGLKELSLTYN